MRLARKPVRSAIRQLTPQASIEHKMEKLNEILRSYVPNSHGEKTSRDELLGAAFVVVNKNGKSSPSSGHIKYHDPNGARLTLSP